MIKPLVDEKLAVDQFIDKPESSWSKILHNIKQEGIPYLLKHLSSLETPANANKYYLYSIKALRYLALLILHIHSVYLHIYGYFYPYSLLSLDEVCNEFSRCPNWTNSVIRAFAWHPNHDRCAVAICNDYIYVYQGDTRIRVLRRNRQHKIVDIAWHPTNIEILAVATQKSVIFWRIVDGPHHSSSSYLAPGPNHQDPDLMAISAQANENNFRIFENVLSPPIISLTFNCDGSKLFACSPNSSKIAVMDINRIFDPNSTEKEMKPQYMTVFGLGLTKLTWSPVRDRLAVGTTASSIRVFEPFNWSNSKWNTTGVISDLAWSGPSGRMLLVATKNSPCLYALPFLDNPQANDVGGNKSLMKVLDLQPTNSELGSEVGGVVQSLAWDKRGTRLAISFRDNSESILLFRTVEKPTVEFHQLGVIQSDNGSSPLIMEFHDKFKNGSLLTICWSDGNCQHIPLSYTAQELKKTPAGREDYLNGILNHTSNSLKDVNSPQRTPRSLTNFCHVSGNQSISAYPNSLTPINKSQHQTTLFSLSRPRLIQKDLSYSFNEN